MWKRRALYLLSGLLVAAGLWAVWAGLSLLSRPPVPGATGEREEGSMAASDKPDICTETSFEGARAVLCVVDATAFEVALMYRGRNGEPYGSVARAVTALAESGRMPVMAMNAGMYHADMTPVGLYVENGEELAPLNTGDGFGNFFLKPNGVFYIQADGSAGVLETGAYAARAIKPAFATQSGPMLVIAGAIHPRFLPDGTTKYIRNGVGVRADGSIVLAITRDPVSLGSFGRLFKDVARCPNALFFDGGVSSFAWGTRMDIDSGEPAGPVVVVFDKPKAVEPE